MNVMNTSAYIDPFSLSIKSPLGNQIVYETFPKGDIKSEIFVEFFAHEEGKYVISLDVLANCRETKKYEIILSDIKREELKNGKLIDSGSLDNIKSSVEDLRNWFKKQFKQRSHNKNKNIGTIENLKWIGTSCPFGMGIMCYICEED